MNFGFFGLDKAQNLTWIENYMTIEDKDALCNKKLDAQIDTSKQGDFINDKSSALHNKVALLIGTNFSNLSNLAEDFAKRGVDVALLCWPIFIEEALALGSRFRTLGRRILIIGQSDVISANGLNVSNACVTDMVVKELGRLDIFVDLSEYDKINGRFSPF